MSRATRYLTALVLASGVLLVVAGAVLMAIPAPEIRDEALWGALFTQAIWILLALSGAVLSRSPGPGERLGLGRGSLPIRASVVLVVGFVALSSGLHQWLVSLELRETGSLAEIDAVVREARARAPSFLLALLALGIAPGFGEELLFRGFIQGGLVSRLGARFGVLLSAALFGLAHFDPVHSSLAFLLGAYLGVATQLSGSIRTAILCHLLNNTLGVLGPALIQGALAMGGGWVTPPLLASALASLFYASRLRGRAGGSLEGVTK
jgi:membrane protease YdiL (CAAX protease family)